MEKRIDDLEKSVGEMEHWRARIDVERAREGADRQHIDDRFDQLGKEILSLKDALKGINSVGMKVVYAVFTAVLVYVVAFVMRGGLSVVG